METPDTPAAIARAELARPALPLACRGPISRRTFSQWLSHASMVAQPESAPVLMVIALDGADERHDDIMLEAAAWQLCDTLGDHGLVCRLGSARIAVMIASDGELSPDAAGIALLGALARPLEGYDGRPPQGARLGSATWGRHGTSAEALFTAAAYALHEASATPLAAAEPAPVTARRRIAVSRS